MILNRYRLFAGLPKLPNLISRSFVLTLITCFVLFWVPAKAQTHSFIVDSIFRNYILHLPLGYDSSIAYPLVLNLHGLSSNASLQELYTGMDSSADKNGYIVAYPNGLGHYWNSWGPPGATYGADDVKFLTELIDTISAQYHVNPKRVYSCGMSNGGYMTYRLACSIADKLAAVASVSGTMSDSTYSSCRPTRKIPIMHIHGTADPVVNYNTGMANSIGVEQTIAFWRDTDACQNITDTTFVPDISTDDSSTVQIIRYQYCSNSKEILFYKIINGGHIWPGINLTVPSSGYTNKDISGTDEIWKFFSRYTLDGPTGIDEEKKAAPVTVYPNPSNGNFYFNGVKYGNTIEIYDLLGQNIYTFYVDRDNYPVGLSGKQKGVYFYKVTDGSHKLKPGKMVLD